MPNLVRVSEFSALEFAEIYSADLDTKNLYRYQFSNAIQLLGPDSDSNSRQFSACPYLQNVLLTPTPVPFIPNTTHLASNLSTLISGNLPLIQYQKVKLHLAAGWVYPSTITALWFRLHVLIDGIDVTLCSIVDQYFSSRIQPNNREYILENVNFSQNLEVDIIDLNFLLNAQSSTFDQIRTTLFGSANPANIGPIEIDFSLVENSDYLNFVQSGNTFTRFIPSDLRRQIAVDVNADQTLQSVLTIDETNHCISMQLLHTSLDTPAYFAQFLNQNEEIQIRHQLTLSYYNSSNVLLATDSIELRNLINEYSLIQYSPINTYSADYLNIDLLSIATNPASSQNWIRTSSLVAKPIQIQANAIRFDITTLNVTNQINRIEQNILASSELPNIVELLKPIYVTLIDQNSSIELTAFDKTYQFSLSTDTTSSKKLFFRLDNSSYSSIIRNRSSVSFLIPAAEYYKSATTFYIVDENSQVILQGLVTRFGKS